MHVPADEVFSLLTRSINLPAQWGALVYRGSGNQVMVPAGGVVEAEDAEQILFIRIAPLQLSVQMAEVNSRDGFSFDADVRFRVHVLPDRAELAGFLQAVMGSRRVIQSESLGSYFQPFVEAALRRFLGERDADELAGATLGHQAAEAVTEALQVPMFKAGMTFDDGVAISLTSQAFRSVQKVRENAAIRQAQHQAGRELNEALRHAREEHLDKLADSLIRLKEMAAASPDAELPKLLRTFSEHQRGQLYEALFATGEGIVPTRWIVAVCSDELLFFDTKNSTQPARRLRVSGPAGAARSVQFAGDDTLLIGAARGVCAWRIQEAEPGRSFITDKVFDSRGGFNAAALEGNSLIGTHSEIGIWEWNWETGESRGPKFLDVTKAARAVRGISALEGDFYCSVDDRVIRWRGGTTGHQPDAVYSGADSIISAILPDREGLFAGTSEGDLLYWPAGTTSDPDRLQRGMNRAIESIQLQQRSGVRRLVYADTSPRVHARVIGDSFAVHFEAGGQTLRRVEVADDFVVAMNELRDKLIVWAPAHPSVPQCVIQVGAICARNMQDFCLVPTTASA